MHKRCNKTADNTSASKNHITNSLWAVMKYTEQCEVVNTPPCFHFGYWANNCTDITVSLQMSQLSPLHIKYKHTQILVTKIPLKSRHSFGFKSKGHSDVEVVGTHNICLLLISSYCSYSVCDTYDTMLYYNIYYIRIYEWIIKKDKLNLTEKLV